MLLSVIIPAYNVESTLQRAVDSVLSQSMKEFEVIIVDDGSTDGTGPLCDAIESQDQRIRVIHQANGGLSAARNTGINQAQGDYLAFLDSDDEYVNDIFSLFYRAYQEYQMDLFIFNFERVSGDQVTPKNAIRQQIFKSQEAVRVLHQYNGLDFYAWNKIWHHSLFDEMRYPLDTLYEDMHVSYLGAKQANCVITTDKVGLRYYDNPLGITAQTFSPGQFDNVTERVKILDDVLIHFPELAQGAARRLFDSFLIVAYQLSQCEDKKMKKKYHSRLLEILKQYQPYFKDNEEISWQKRLAWSLYQVSPSLYSHLYRMYLS
ncbi:MULTISPECIES: glycosyltransferase family 2 protein [Aerococcus]|uniref:glycosyltransferase family 2 protein n=1 Tax=Aerococcus urinae (strain CCUG 59500 / ACS-120-V-Col10a) TaxID=2976812 RepID=UPI000200F23E|nr:glycosyltransferase family 2 protein [Aerococcus sp. Group 1]AEA01774.1 glycosyltransferase, group 2 family protein [Aerococcus sp. Group 1]MCY3030090.1 glycosyltransferase [Aerococcus sp. Group 1]MCY3054403.1 glycosyltransferase [Aerococcus sp. Group 1]MCY3056133.1 glycosyltransferase [Aerococcus sp. Group 1]MCY3061112.1 glycosyltransferase [Aerococcus sp. Group 1]